MHSALTYTLLDLGGALWGTIVFATAMLAPGYLASWCSQIADFRHRSPPEQLAWSIALSTGIGTIAIVALTWLGGVTFMAVLLAGTAVAAMLLFLRVHTHRVRLGKPHALAFAWGTLVLLSLTDLGAGHRLAMSVTTFDHAVRVPFVDAVMRTGVVPVNPLYWPGHGAPLRYYYFWYVTCGVIARLAHISARQALTASCVWPPIAVVAMLALYGKYLLGWRAFQLRARAKLATSLMAITGLDILIAVINWLAGGKQNGDMEWWSVDQVSSWADSFLWVPHHVAALVCCLLAFLLVWMARDLQPRRQRILAAIFAGLSFASAFGLSTFIAISFCLVMVLWTARLLITTRDRRQLTAVATASIVAAITLTPYVLQLLHQGATNESSTPTPHILSLAVRQVLVPDHLAAATFIAHTVGQSQTLRTNLAALLLLPFGYAIELGFFAVVLWRFVRLRGKTEAERTLLFLLLSALATVTFFRSTVITTNDYGIRATLPAQFFLLLAGVRVWEDSLTNRRIFLRTLAAIGIAGSIYQVINLRLFLPIQQARGNPLMRDLAEREYAMRDAYAQLHRVAPTSGRIQYGAPATGYYDATHTLSASRQIIAAGTTGNDCNTGFGGEVSACASIRQAGAALYNPPHLIAQEAAASLCRQIGADMLVATRWDPVWRDANAWPWRLPVLVAMPDVRIVACSAP